MSQERQNEENVVLCGSNSYEKKYYFNEMFSNIPEDVQKELKILCVWFTEECGGILTLEFNERGNLQICFATSDYDGYCDEIGADLKIRQMRRERRDFFRALELYYKTVALGMNLEELEESDLEEDEDESDGYEGAGYRRSGYEGAGGWPGDDGEEDL